MQMTPETAQALGQLGAILAISVSAIGSAMGTGAAGAAAIGAWKKCYAQSKAAPFMLVAFVGMPLSQTIYGIILMNSLLGKAKAGFPFAALIGVGLFGGMAIASSAWLQGRAGAGASDALAETGKGFANYLAVLGVIETVAIFVMVFIMIALGG